MAHRDDARQWFEGLFMRQPFTPEAVQYFRGLRLEVGTLDEPMGGGYWFGDRGLVMLRGTQDEAAITSWRTPGGNNTELVSATR